MTSQRFIDTRDGSIVTQVPISEIAHFEEYAGNLQAGDVDARSAEVWRALAATTGEPDWLDSHLEIIGVSDDVANKIKDRLRREF